MAIPIIESRNVDSPIYCISCGKNTQPVINGEVDEITNKNVCEHLLYIYVNEINGYLYISPEIIDALTKENYTVSGSNFEDIIEIESSSEEDIPMLSEIISLNDCFELQVKLGSQFQGQDIYFGYQIK